MSLSTFICPECRMETDGRPCPFTRCPRRRGHPKVEAPSGDLSTYTLLRCAVAGYDAQYGKVPVGEQHDLPKGCSDRVEAVVNAARVAAQRGEALLQAAHWVVAAAGPEDQSSVIVALRQAIRNEGV